jgi:dTDP-4-amino-4,6-dideoxygalactose transaminase
VGQVPDVVLPVSYSGEPCDLPAMDRLAKQYGFKLIEDASHALGSRYCHEGQWVHCGSNTHSDLATFSFHPVKNITTAEGGMITTNDPELYERCLMLRNHGMTKKSEAISSPFAKNQKGDVHPWFYEVTSLGYNGRLSDVHAALGLSQLSKLDAFKASRREQMKKYNQAFSKMESLLIPQFNEDQSDPFSHIYTLRCVAGEKEKARLFQYLVDHHILPQVHYVPIHYHAHFAEHLAGNVAFPNAEKFYQQEISLPLYPKLSEAEQDKVIQTVKQFYVS